MVGAIPGSSKKQPSCHAHCEETCVPPFPQFNVVTSLCLERPSKKQPFRLGCRHAFGSNIDQGAAGGPGVMLQHVGGWLFLFEEPGEDFFLAYGCANANLNNFPFARAKTPIQTHFHLHSCYPQTKKQRCSICSACGQKLEIRSCVPCARIVRALCKTRSLCNSASGGVEAHSLFVGSSCEDESVFGLGFWHASLRLHIHKSKKQICCALFGLFGG